MTALHLPQTKTLGKLSITDGPSKRTTLNWQLCIEPLSDDDGANWRMFKGFYIVIKWGWND